MIVKLPRRRTLVITSGIAATSLSRLPTKCEKHQEGHAEDGDAHSDRPGKGGDEDEPKQAGDDQLRQGGCDLDHGSLDVSARRSAGRLHGGSLSLVVPDDETGIDMECSAHDSARSVAPNSESRVASLRVVSPSVQVRTSASVSPSVSMARIAAPARRSRASRSLRVTIRVRAAASSLLSRSAAFARRRAWAATAA